NPFSMTALDATPGSSSGVASMTSSSGVRRPNQRATGRPVSSASTQVSAISLSVAAMSAARGTVAIGAGAGPQRTIDAADMQARQPLATNPLQSGAQASSPAP